MRITVELSEVELKEALRDYCEREVSQDIGEKAISISYISPTNATIEVDLS